MEVIRPNLIWYETDQFETMRLCSYECIERKRFPPWSKRELYLMVLEDEFSVLMKRL